MSLTHTLKWFNLLISVHIRPKVVKKDHLCEKLRSERKHGGNERYLNNRL